MRYVVGLCAVLLACLVSSASATSPVSARHAHQPLATGHSASSAHGLVSSGHDASGAVRAAAPGSLTEAALRLEALVGQHSILASDMMRARVRADEDLAQAANAALGKNTKAMGDLLEPVIGAPGRAQFATLWGEHIEALFNYSRGLSIRDAAVREDSRTALVEDESQLAALFAAASQGRLDRDAALAGVHVHIDHLLQGADAYAEKDYEAAAKAYRLSYSHTFDLGATLARALLPASVGRALDSPTERLRSALTKLLGEHVALVIAAMRSSVGDADDFTAMGASVNGNTLDLTAAIDSLFGEAAAEGFQARWADHVDQLMAYTTATVDGDEAGQERARAQLREFERSFAAYLSTATQNRLGEAALAQTFVMHDRMLLAEIDAYTAKNFQQAHDLSYRTYEDMFTVSAQLAGAIGATVASRLPRGGSHTGAGSMAKAVEGR